ncbi:hypothetical protein C8F01DRAFT_1237655 [Mycena amicta]|nr:hypothetical protein C8F01DRAFT_1237655 [Mycena amicta]
MDIKVNQVQRSPSPASSITSISSFGARATNASRPRTRAPSQPVPKSNEVYLSDEVWLEILKTLPTTSYPSFSLTNRQLRNIALPTLFAHFSFHPYAVKDEQLLLPPSATVDEAMDRLNFWASDRIAGLVRSCTISPWSQQQSHAKHNRPYTLQNAFFDKLPLFTRLKRLDASFIHITAHDVTSLARLTSLESFTSVRCPIPSSGKVNRAKKTWSLPSFTFTALNFEEDGQELAFWLSLLDPTHLARVVLPMGLALGFPLGKVSKFPSVMSLSTACCPNENIVHLECLLSLVPNLQRLEISLGHACDPILHEDSLSALSHHCTLTALRDLTIPGEFLRTFLPATSIARLSVEWFEPDYLADFFGSLPSYRSLVSLTATTLYLGIDDFRSIVNNLPCLSKFKIVSEYWDTEPNFFHMMENTVASGFFNDLLSPDTKLPATLTCLAIVLKLEISFLEEVAIPHGFIDPAWICEGLRARCPNLRFFWLDGADFLIRWSSTRKENALRSYQVKQYGRAFYSRDDAASGKFTVRCGLKRFGKVQELLDGVWARVGKDEVTTTPAN